MCGFIVLALIDGNVMVFGHQTAYTQTNHPDKDRTHTHDILYYNKAETKSQLCTN